MIDKSFELKFIQALEENFNICKEKELNNRKFDFIAEYDMRTCKYMISKKNEIYAFNNKEYILYEEIPNSLTDEYVNCAYEFIKNNIDNVVERDKEFMSGNITYIICGNGGSVGKVKKAKYYKSYMLGFKGWVNVSFIYIDKENKKVIGRGGNEGIKKVIRNIL